MTTNKKRQHKLLGLCTQCSEPVSQDRSCCPKHLLSQAKSQQIFRKKCIAEGICPCSAPLHPEIDLGRTYCIKCREDRLWNY